MSTLNVNNINEAGGVDAVITAGVLDSGSLPAGSILQVVSTTKTDHFSTTSSTFTDVTGLSVSITPLSATSKILALVNINMSIASGADGIGQLVRGATVIGSGTAGTGVNGFAFAVQASDIDIPNSAMSFLDSPATTSATTYKVQIRRNGAQTLFLNRRANDAFYGMSSSITLMEIAG